MSDISGMPGTGKTATVLQIVRELCHKHHLGVRLPFAANLRWGLLLVDGFRTHVVLCCVQQLPEFQFVELNGMKLPDPQQAYSVLWYVHGT